MHESDKWVQKTINVSTLDKVYEILKIYPDISYSTYRMISDLLKINWFSNFVIRLIVSTKHSILPKIIIDTLEYDFVTKYYQDLSLKKLLQFTIRPVNNIKQLIPNFSKLGEEQNNVKAILTIMIKEELKHRQDVEYINNSKSSTFYVSISKITITNYLSNNLANDKAHSIVAASNQWNFNNEYLFNLNDIRTSIRLQKKRKLRQDKKLEELRQQQILLSQRKSHRRTKRYNQKARKKLIKRYNQKDQVSTIVSDDSVAINIGSDKAKLSMDDSKLQVHIPLQSSLTCSPNLIEGHNVLQHQRGQNRRKKRPKMIIVDKSQGYDYLIQEYFLEPNSNTMYMVINTYLDNNVYKATTCHIDCETQDLHSTDFKVFNIHGNEGIIKLINDFYALVTEVGVWPSTNEQWMEAQDKDLFWSTMLTKLNQPNTCIVLKRQDNHVDYLTRELLDDNTVGPLIRYISVPKQLSHSHLVLSYREEFRQMIVSDHLISSCVDITHRALGHPGFHRMWNAIRKSYFWKSMQTDVRLYCSNNYRIIIWYYHIKKNLDK